MAATDEKRRVESARGSGVGARTVDLLTSLAHLLCVSLRLLLHLHYILGDFGSRHPSLLSPPPPSSFTFPTRKRLAVFMSESLLHLIPLGTTTSPRPRLLSRTPICKRQRPVSPTFEFFFPFLFVPLYAKDELVIMSDSIFHFMVGS